MNTATIDTEFDAIAAANKDTFSNVLSERSAVQRLRNAPRALREWIGHVAEFFHLSAVKDGAAVAYRKTQAVLTRVLGPVRAVGIMNIFGALITCGEGRKVLTKTLSLSYRIVTTPLRLLGRALGWLGRKVGLGSAVDVVETKVAVAEDYVVRKYNAAMEWLESHEHVGGMSWARSYFQLGVKRRLIGAYAPQRLRTPLYIASLFVPDFGVHGKAESPVSLVKDTIEQSEKEDGDVDTKAAIAEAEEILKAQAKDTTVTPMPEVKETWVGETIPAVLVGTGAPVKLRRETSNTGKVRIRFNGKKYEEGALPSHIKVLDPAEVTVEEPPLNREARRAAGERGAKQA